jgi:signal transduction histidine kinase
MSLLAAAALGLARPVAAQSSGGDWGLPRKLPPEPVAVAEPPGMRFAPEREDGARYEVQRVDARTLVVYRARSAAPGLEGSLVDVPELLSTLHARVLVQRGLGAVGQLTMLGDGPVPELADGAFGFDYAFTEPFGAVRARLTLSPLDDAGERGLLVALAAGLAGALALGLYALYRMAAVQLAFAERRSNFVSAVSHELKTPLTAIRMYGEILRDGLVDDDTKRGEYYGLIASESERLSRLVDNVLELARIERGERALELTRGDVGPAVREAVSVLSAHAAQRGFTLAFEEKGPLPPVRFHPDALKQIVFNLVDNALKYARDAADKRVDVTCSASPSGVNIVIRDRGPGLPPAELTRIFEPFYRAGAELTRRHEGVGLGLSLVKRLVTSMGGTVDASLAQPGLEVTVRLDKG